MGGVALGDVGGGEGVGAGAGSDAGNSAVLAVVRWCRRH